MPDSAYDDGVTDTIYDTIVDAAKNIDLTDVGGFIFGGLDYGVIEAIEILRGRKNHLFSLVYEPDKAARDALASDIPRGVLVSDTLPSLRRRMRFFLQELVGDINLIVRDESAYRQDVLDLWQIAVDENSLRQMNSGNCERRVRDMLESADLLTRHPPLNLLAGRFAETPIVIAGAGPSLNRQIETLKKYRSKYILACVNTSWPALDKHGLVPDFVVCCEAKPVGKTIENIASLPDMLFVPGLHVNRDTWALPWRAIAPGLSHEGAFGEWACGVFDTDPFPIGPSAACLATGIGYLLGCDPIFLVGCDCAPSGDVLYADDTAFAGTTVSVQGNGGTKIKKSQSKIDSDDLNRRREAESWSATVETWNYDRTAKIPSLMAYDTLRQWKEEVSDVWSRDRRIVNAGGMGAHILGWEHTPLDQCRLDEYPDIQCARDLICDALKTLSPRRSHDLRVSLEHQREGALEVGRLAFPGIALMDRARQIRDEMHADGVDTTQLDTYTWSRTERARHQHERPVFEVFAEFFDAAGRTDAGDIMRDARRIQMEISRTGQRAELLDAYCYGAIDQARRSNESVFAVFRVMFSEIERGSREISELIDKTLSRLDGLNA